MGEKQKNVREGIPVECSPARARGSERAVLSQLYTI